MNQSALPGAHSNPWVNLLRGYVTGTVDALARHDLRVQRSWLDPCDPRDATIVYLPTGADSSAEAHALVWDEETGWRTGRFEAGRPGVRTELADAVHLGGGLLLDPADAACRVTAGVAEAPRTYRSYTEVRDGLDDVLRDRWQVDARLSS